MVEAGAEADVVAQELTEKVVLLLKPFEGAEEAATAVVTVVEGPLMVGVAVVRKERSKSVTEKEDFE